jgi:hypothetical protein
MKWIAAVLVFAASSARAADSVSFKKDVQPILKESCLKCHSFDPKKPKKKGAGELRMDDEKLAMKGGRSGPAIVPGKAQDSLLYKLLNGPAPRPVPEEDDKDIDPMPKAKRGEKWKQLPAAKIAVLKAWIDQGANWSD